MRDRAILYGRVVLCVANVLCLAGSLSASDAWWNPAWKCRYAIIGADFGAGTAAWVKFNIPPGCAPDGSDIRIIDDKGAEIPRQVLFFEPGLYGIVAFDVAQARPRYWLYLSNPDPKTPASSWTAQAGVFLTTRELGQGSANNGNEMKQLLLNSRWAYGAGFRPKIFEGFDPFGEPTRFVSEIRAWLQIKRAGQYSFFTVSADASFLIIDGQPVTQWPGAHRAEGGQRGRFQGKINLKPGVHELDYYHCNLGTDQVVMEAAWMPPGATQPALISETDFVPIRPAQAGPLEIYNQPVAPDFSGAQEEWCRVGEDTYTIYTFSDLSTSAGGRIVKCAWEFSDGWRGEGEQLPRMFFHKGDFSVKLTVADDKGRQASIERPFRVFAIDRGEPSDERMVGQAFANMIESVNLQQLAREDAVRAGRLLIAQDRSMSAAKLYETLLGAPGEPAADTDLTIAYLDLMCGSLGQSERGVDVARRVLGRLDKDPVLAARLASRIGRAELDDLNRVDDALTDFKAADLRLQGVKKPDPQMRRNTLIGLGDAQRALGQAEEARAAYEQAEAIHLPGQKKSPFDISSDALTVESHLLQREYDEAQRILDQWELEHPTERLEGYSSILRARLALARGDRAGAVLQLERFLSCKPVGVFAKQAMLLLAQCYEVSGEADKARALYLQLLEQFQDEDIQAQARQGMDRLAHPGGPPPATVASAPATAASAEELGPGPGKAGKAGKAAKALGRGAAELLGQPSNAAQGAAARKAARQAAAAPKASKSPGQSPRKAARQQGAAP
ncbi:MAG: PKD domain-containing protein [Candidatus Sumerlaeota bacterium]|nr:PKD domain-containing protein [Candidatus Sumerlaeota bacterium]